jgi:bifunctional non-homologous end joining protein LigD
MADRLEKYRTKRDFSLTAEPAGKKARTPRRQRGYLIQKHAARREHYDFRLEHDGVLLSWAIPKGPSFDPADKRLAVHTEDHPVEYGGFEGTIPKGQYGGGTVMLWDRGTWEPLGDVNEGLAKGNLKFELHGERLHGHWALIHLRSRGPQDRGKDNWLLIKEKDDYARPGGKPVVERETTSVKTGRTMDEIGRGEDVWQSNRAPKAAPVKKKKKAAPRTTAGLKKKSGAGSAKIPPFIEPQLATLVDAPPSGGGWVHEIKFDGYRALASVAGGNVVIRTRKGLDWTDKFAGLKGPLSELDCGSVLLDGEVTVKLADGKTDFGALQNALSAGSTDLTYCVFDLLFLDGQDLRDLPLDERKAKLEKLLASSKDARLAYSEHLTGSGEKIFREACALGLEGIISKRADDPYRSGRTKGWLKIKCGMEQEFVIIGWRPSDKAGRPFSSLLLALNEKGKLRYCGRVGTGYTEARLDDLGALFKKYARATPPVEGIPRDIARRAKFVEPKLVAEIEFRGWTRDGMVRQGSFKGLRGDKPAAEVTREQPMPTRKAVAAPARSGVKPKQKKTAAAPAAGGKESDTIAGIRITHPDRAMFDKPVVTKRDIAAYYVAVADLMLPHVVGRPLALVRCPDGSSGECFFQKHASPGWPDEFKKVRIKEKSGSDQYLYIEDERGLVAAAQMGVLEIHIWGSRVPDVENPDRLVFDFDPDEGLDFNKVKDAARDLKRRLERLDLQSFPMVSGGKGIHVVVPLKPGHSWDDHRSFAEAKARLMEEEDPAHYVANMSKAKRRGRIFVDYLRNQRGATAIAPYSTRARVGAFVSLPVSWAALGKLTDAHPLDVASAMKKLPKAKDVWPGYDRLRQKLPLGKVK